MHADEPEPYAGGGGRREPAPLPYVPRLPGSDAKPELLIRKTRAPITLVTRSGCAVCGRARQMIENSARRYRLAIEEVNVERDHPEVFKKWEFDLPVVLIDGKRRFSGHINHALLERALQSRPV